MDRGLRDIGTKTKLEKQFMQHTENRPFFPSLFSPTFLVPDLMLLEDEVNGSGAATFDNFYQTYRMSENSRLEYRNVERKYLFTFLADHNVGYVDLEK